MCFRLLDDTTALYPATSFMYDCRRMTSLACWQASLGESQFSLDKSLNPILATQASPGMGKSSFIDVLCSLTLDDVRKLGPAGVSEDFCISISKSQRVVIDFNGVQNVKDFDLSHPVGGLALRVLHSYVTWSVCLPMFHYSYFVNFSL